MKEVRVMCEGSQGDEGSEGDVRGVRVMCEGSEGDVRGE